MLTVLSQRRAVLTVAILPHSSGSTRSVRHFDPCRRGLLLPLDFNDFSPFLANLATGLRVDVLVLAMADSASHR
jgi:hypothetical protein